MASDTLTGYQNTKEETQQEELQNHKEKNLLKYKSDSDCLLSMISNHWLPYSFLHSFIHSFIPLLISLVILQTFHSRRLHFLSPSIPPFNPNPSTPLTNIPQKSTLIYKQKLSMNWIEIQQNSENLFSNSTDPRNFKSGFATDNRARNSQLSIQ
jgi:hypothetical protein